MPRAADRKKRAKAAHAPEVASRAPEPASPGPAPEPGANAAKRPSPSVAVAGFELHELKRLIHLVQRTGIGELELNAGGRSVRISATPANGAWLAAPQAGAAPAAGALPSAPASAPTAAGPPAAPKEPAGNQPPDMRESHARRQP